MSSIKIKDILKITGGDPVNCSYDTVITGINTIKDAGENDITFLSNNKYMSDLSRCRAACVIVSNKNNLKLDIPRIEVSDPVKAFRKVVEFIKGEIIHPVKGVSSLAAVSSSADIGDNVGIGDNVKIEPGVSIGPGTVIYPGVYIGENVKIGSNCLIYPNVSVLREVEIGDKVIVHSGTVIGSDGFGYSTEEGRHIKMPQTGKVIIADDVEIGSNVSIDRGSPGNTCIGEGTKIDNLVQIAHNVSIGKRCLIVSQVGIAGSTKVEDYAVLAGQAGIVGHIRIGRGAQVGAQAGVTRDVKAGQQVSGYPAADHRTARKLNVLIRKLPDLYEQVKKLKKSAEK